MRVVWAGIAKWLYSPDASKWPGSGKDNPVPAGSEDMGVLKEAYKAFYGKDTEEESGIRIEVDLMRKGVLAISRDGAEKIMVSGGRIPSSPTDLAEFLSKENWNYLKLNVSGRAESYKREDLEGPESPYDSLKDAIEDVLKRAPVRSDIRMKWFRRE